jgi:CheY-like chemotaxis protein
LTTIDIFLTTSKRFSILKSDEDQQINELEELVFGEDLSNQSIANDLDLQLEYANQGEAGYEKALQAHAEGHRYFMAFVDVRMPPGIDGVQTIKKLWHEFPDMPCVICTAHSDYEWHQLVEHLGRTPNLLVLRKPFDPIEVRQIVLALYEQTRLTQMSNRLMESMTQQAQTINQGQARRLEHLTDEFRAPLVSVLSYGERLLATNFDEETRQLEVNRICAHTRFLLDLLDKFSGEHHTLSPQTSPVERQRCNAGQSNRQLKSEPGGEVDLRGKRILLAEDSPELQRMTTNILSNVGAQVTIAENGVSALAKFMQLREGNQPFDLALLDLQMPMMDGCTVARRMTALGNDTPTFVMVNKPSKDVEQRCKLAGCVGVVSKPVQRDTLLLVLKNELCTA